MPGTYSPLNEWCDENAHRQFPLDDAATGRDTTGLFVLPQTFMVDMLLAVPLSRDISKFYVKGVVVRRLFVEVEIGYDDPIEGAVSVARIRNIPHNSPRNTAYYTKAVIQSDDNLKDFEISTGCVVVGSCSDIVKQPGSYQFTPAAGKILEARIEKGLACVQSIMVNSQILTGNVKLREGDNVSIRPVYNPSTGITEIVISASSSGTESGGVSIASDEDLLDALIARYGQPIISINGQYPAATGEFLMTGKDCTSLQNVTNGLAVSNPCAEPCCDKSMLKDAYAVMSELNLRYAVLESYYQSISLNINQMQARMIGFEV